MPSAPNATVEALSTTYHETLARLRSIAPLAWIAALDGWVVTTRELAAAVMRDPTTFTVDDPRFSTARVIGPSMLSLDGSEHSRHRDPFASAYRPAEVVRRYSDTIATTARSLVDTLAPRGAAELRRELAGPLAVAVVAVSLGLDDLDPEQLLSWYDLIVAGVEQGSLGTPIDAAAHDAFRSLGAALHSALHRPGSVLHQAATTLTPDELVSNAAVFLFGGIETSEGMTSNLLAHLLTNPDQLTLVRDDRTHIDNAVEESLRLEPAATRVDRYATVDIELSNTTVHAGELVIVSLAAANRDPATYPDPDRFDIKRDNARTHLAFAQGPHACIGAQLARMQTRAALDAVLDKLPGITLRQPPTTTGLVFRKPAALDARWDTA